MHFSPHIYVDFDGTISLLDTTDLLLERFAAPEWREVERAWERGEIGSQECMMRQISLLRIAPDELDRFLCMIPLDPEFPAFVQACEQLNFPVTIISDGLDRTIKAALSGLALKLPVAANRLEWLGNEAWKLSFPEAREGCRVLAGHCKCATMAETRRARILIGDGRSDFCAAEQADMVFAKEKLLTYCRENGLPHLAYETFADLLPTFRGWLESLEAVPMPLHSSLDDYKRDSINVD
jgi:2,3-diketo-5-methylthio-1-phosphopentane phosphatase